MENLPPSKSRKECITSKTYLHQNLVRNVLQVKLTCIKIF